MKQILYIINIDPADPKWIMPDGLVTHDIYKALKFERLANALAYLRSCNAWPEATVEEYEPEMNSLTDVEITRLKQRVRSAVRDRFRSWSVTEICTDHVFPMMEANGYVDIGGYYTRSGRPVLINREDLQYPTLAERLEELAERIGGDDGALISEAVAYMEGGD